MAVLQIQIQVNSYFRGLYVKYILFIYLFAFVNIPTVNSSLFYFLELCFRNTWVVGFVCLFVKS